MKNHPDRQLPLGALIDETVGRVPCAHCNSTSDCAWYWMDCEAQGDEGESRQIRVTINGDTERPCHPGGKV